MMKTIELTNLTNLTNYGEIVATTCCCCCCPRTVQLDAARAMARLHGTSGHQRHTHHHSRPRGDGTHGLQSRAPMGTRTTKGPRQGGPAQALFGPDPEPRAPHHSHLGGVHLLRELCPPLGPHADHYRPCSSMHPCTKLCLALSRSTSRCVSLVVFRALPLLGRGDQNVAGRLAGPDDLLLKRLFLYPCHHSRGAH